MAWVTRSLVIDDWTAIREIGVQYDAALVVTTRRAKPDAPANEDTFTVWTVSLTSHDHAQLITGVNLRWLDFMSFGDSNGPEPAVLYDSCRECAAETYFTSFHYVAKNHGWSARWMRNGQAVPVWSTNTPTGMVWTQAYAGMAEPDGRALIGTWNRFDYGPKKPVDDFLFVYDLDPNSGLERTRRLSGPEAEALKLRICRATGRATGHGAGARWAALRDGDAEGRAEACDDAAGERTREVDATGEETPELICERGPGGPRNSRLGSRRYDA